MTPVYYIKVGFRVYMSYDEAEIIKFAEMYGIRNIVQMDETIEKQFDGVICLNPFSTQIF